MAAYLSTVLLAEYTAFPANLWLGGENGLLLRPEPAVIPAALPFGVPAILGTSVGVLLHNLLFRLTPGGVSIAFSVAQTLVVAVASLIAMVVRARVPRPFNNLAATWVVSASLVLVLGAFASYEYGTAVVEEWQHIFREVLLPINAFGLLILEVGGWMKELGTRGRQAEA